MFLRVRGLELFVRQAMCLLMKTCRKPVDILVSHRRDSASAPLLVIVSEALILMRTSSPVISFSALWFHTRLCTLAIPHC